MNIDLTSALPGFLRKKLEGRDQLRRIIANAGWLFVDKVVRYGIGIVVLALLARYLGPEKYGAFNFALAFVALFSPVALLGLDNITVRNLVLHPDRTSEQMGTTFALRLIGSLTVMIAGLILIAVLRPSDDVIRLLVLLLSSATLFQSADVIDLWFQSQIKSRYTVIAKMTAFILMSALRIAMIMMAAPVIAFAGAVLLESMFSAFMLWIFYRAKALQKIRWTWNGTLAIQLLRESIPLIFSGIAIMMYMKVDQIMLGEMLGDRAVGIYTAATRLSEMWYFIALAVVSSSFPAIVSSKAMGTEIYMGRMRRLFRALAVMAWGIAIFNTLFANQLIELIFGSEYAEAAPVLAVHTWATLAVYMGIARESWIISEGLGRFLMFATLAGAVINVILNLILIPEYGPMGAAIATTVSYAVANFVAPFFYKKTIPIGKMMLTELVPFLWINK